MFFKVAQSFWLPPDRPDYCSFLPLPLYIHVFQSLQKREVAFILFVISSSLELFVDRNRVLLHSVSHICITGPDTLKMLSICWIHNFIIRQILNTKILFYASCLLLTMSAVQIHRGKRKVKAIMLSLKL